MAARARRFSRILLALTIGLGVSIHGTGSATAATDIGLAGAADYAILAGSTVTNTGPTVASGHVGVWAGAAIVGFGGAPDGTVIGGGVVHAGDAHAEAAQTGLTAAMVASSPATQPDEGAALLGPQLGGLTLFPGAYTFGSLDLTGTLTLDAQGDQEAVFIIRSGSDLITAGSSVVQLQGDAQACKVYWLVDSSATLGATSSFVGTVMADQSISVGNGATIQGRLLASIGAVTLINDTITRPTCLPPVPVVIPFVPAPTTTTTSTTSTTLAPTTTTSTTAVVAAPTLPVTPPTTATPVRARRAGSQVIDRSGGGSGSGTGIGAGGPGDGSGITGDLPRTGTTPRTLLLTSLLAVLTGSALLVSGSDRKRPAHRRTR